MGPILARLAQAPDLPRWAVIKDARQRQRQRRRRMRMAVAIGAALIAAAAWALRSDRSPTPRLPEPAQPSATHPASVSLGGTPIDAVAARGAVWVLVCPRRCSGTEVSSGALLQVASRSDRVISRFPVADPQALTLGAGAIWIAHFATDMVTRVDPRTGRAGATINLALPQPLATGDRRFLPSGISFGAGMVWVSTARGQLAVISARTSRQVAMVPSPSEETHTTVAGHRTWVAEDLAGIGFIAHDAHRLTIHRISQAGQPVDVIDVKSGGGRIWTFGPSNPGSPGKLDTNVITALDPTNSHVEHQLQINGAGETIAYGNGALYVADFNRGLLFRINAANYKVDTLPSERGGAWLVGTTPGALWAATPSGKLLRITVPQR
jgi:hypothetical protein